MTPEEIKELVPCLDYWCAVLPCVCMNNINSTIAAEREACAKVALDIYDNGAIGQRVAAAIRARNMTQSELEKWRSETGDTIEAMRQACADDCASLERQLEDKDAEIVELRAEVERLKVARDSFYDDTVELRKQLIDLRAEVERLTRLNDIIKNAHLREKLMLRTDEAVRADLKRLQTENERLVGMTGNLRIENAELRAEVERLNDLLPAWKIVENNERLRARVAELEGALKPFADAEINELRAEVERLRGNCGFSNQHYERIIADLNAEVERLSAELNHTQMSGLSGAGN